MKNARIKNTNTMKQDKYRIVCTIDGTFTVQDKASNGEWMEVHRCEAKNEAGLNEARLWIDKEGGEE